MPIDFTVNISTDNIIWCCHLPRSRTPDLKIFMEKHFKKFLIISEIHDKEGKPVEEHFHLWGESHLNSNKHLTDSFTKSFPELTRKGRGGSHLKSQIKNLSDEYQFYYNFKNYESSIYTCHDSQILTQSILKSFNEKQKELKILKEIKHKFYQYCLESKRNLSKTNNIINLYIDFCDINNKEPTTFDCEKKVNFVLMKNSPQQLKKQFIDNYSRKFSQSIL